MTARPVKNGTARVSKNTRVEHQVEAVTATTSGRRGTLGPISSWLFAASHCCTILRMLGVDALKRCIVPGAFRNPGENFEPPKCQCQPTAILCVDSDKERDGFNVANCCNSQSPDDNGLQATRLQRHW